MFVRVQVSLDAFELWWWGSPQVPRKTSQKWGPHPLVVGIYGWKCSSLCHLLQAVQQNTDMVKNRKALCRISYRDIKICSFCTWLIGVVSGAKFALGDCIISPGYCRYLPMNCLLCLSQAYYLQYFYIARILPLSAILLLHTLSCYVESKTFPFESVSSQSFCLKTFCKVCEHGCCKNAIQKKKKGEWLWITFSARTSIWLLEVVTITSSGEKSQTSTVNW